jgi:O-acetyl-ADP-ribose deacetylase (regulator of RNase III)
MPEYKRSSKLAIVTDDLLGMHVDGIVNPTNTDLLMGAGIGGEIRKRAGMVIQEKCLEIGSIGLGQAVVTEGGNLEVPHIIHVAVMKIGGVTSEKNLIRSIESMSRRINEYKMESVALPPLGIGVGRFPIRRCAEVMIETILAHVVNRRCLKKISIVLDNEEDFGLFEETYATITSGGAQNAGVHME